jgi:hypothetical protein
MDNKTKAPIDPQRRYSIPGDLLSALVRCVALDEEQRTQLEDAIKSPLLVQGYSLESNMFAVSHPEEFLRIVETFADFGISASSVDGRQFLVNGRGFDHGAFDQFFLQVAPLVTGRAVFWSVCEVNTEEGWPDYTDFHVIEHGRVFSANHEDVMDWLQYTPSKDGNPAPDVLTDVEEIIPVGQDYGTSRF